MKLFHSFGNMIQYVFEAVTRIFSPNKDHYPVTGVQPFEGRPYEESDWTD